MRPIPLWQSALWFGLPGLALFVGVTLVNPRLAAAGVPLIWSFSLLFYSPLLLVAAAAVIAYRRDGYPMMRRAFAQRMRLVRMTRRDWGWTMGGLLLALVAEGLIADPATRLLAGLPGFTPPDALPALFDPFQPLAMPPTHFFGTPLARNGWVALVHAAGLVINIGGEELAWRGYLLPRQEFTHHGRA